MASTGTDHCRAASNNRVGASPLERRSHIGCPLRGLKRSTESSCGLRMGRLCESTKSATAIKSVLAFSSSNTIGAWLIFPLVATKGLGKAEAIACNSGAYGSMTPRWPSPGAMASNARGLSGFSFSGTSTMGETGPKRASRAGTGRTTSAWRRARSGYSRAKGLEGLCFLCRSVRSAFSCVASAMSRKPPTPLTATIWPCASAFTAFFRTVSESCA